jgi:hypothetical protein
VIGEFNAMALEPAWKYTIEQYGDAGLSWMVWSYKAAHGDATDGWGVFNARDPWPLKPDIQHDSAERIHEKWSAWGASAFAPNPMLKRALAMPIPMDDAYRTGTGEILNVNPPGILANDKHLNLGQPGVKLSARKLSGPAHGTLTLKDDGSFTYTPEKGFIGVDSFRYRAFDDRLDSASIGSVRISVGP